MQFLLATIFAFAILGFVIFVIPFSYFFITNYFTVRKIENEVLDLSLEWATFSAREVWAKSNNISQTEAFEFVYETDELVATSKKISQLDYLIILREIVAKIDTALSKTSDTLKKSPLLEDHIKVFDMIKDGINAANPYSH